MKKADYIFHNGIVVTADKENNLYEAIGVKDDKILSLGTNKEIMEVKGEETEIIDLKGNTLCPGIIDSHAHTIVSGITKDGFVDVFPSAVASLKELYEVVKNEVDKTEKGKWIVFWGYDEMRMLEKEHPTKEMLDKLAPDNPILVARCEIHSGVFNSLGFEKCNMDTERAKEFTSKEVERSEKGELQGRVTDNAYYDMLSYVEFDPKAIERGIERESFENIKVGVTSVHDAGGFGKHTNIGIVNAVESGKFKLRAHVMFFSFFGKENYMRVNEEFAALGIGRNLIKGERLKFGTAKFMIDGASSVPSAAMLEPYSHSKDDMGTMSLEREEIEQLAIELHASGCQLSAHAVGDRAIEMWLDIIEKAQSVCPRKDARHRIEHCFIPTEEQMDRIKKLSLIPVLNLNFIDANGERYIDYYGERSERIFPAKSLIDRDIICTSGTDNPIFEENPLVGMACAMDRKSSDGTIVGPSQKITFLEAIKIFTYNGAYTSFSENETGSLEIGKKADLTVFLGDLTKMTPDEIRKSSCALTMIDGEMLYNTNIS